ncbi:hypothetical protein BCF11_4901 [Collimonas sp. PA-H2]|nr:hypothetical protein BCF11_4901 [Collimonas sp. PA-H2]
MEWLSDSVAKKHSGEGIVQISGLRIVDWREEFNDGGETAN